MAFPVPGSVVEYIEDNQIQIAMVMEEAGGKLRLLLPSRRETKLGGSRILPWIGPLYSPATTREEGVRILERHGNARKEKAAAINTEEVWQLAAGEIAQAPASWFAELFESDPDIDAAASYGRALLEDKVHFRFAAPEFTVYNVETVAKREEERKKREEREALAGKGAAFFQILREIAAKKRPAPADGDFSPFMPDEAIAAKLESLLFARMANPDTQQDENLWQLLTRGMPEDPLLPVLLLEAWGKIPPHYNFWLDRAGYERNDWWRGEEKAIETLLGESGSALERLPLCDSPFVSIDGDDTKDIDDAFYLEKLPTGWKARLAFANPALRWPFGSALDKLVAERATSLYLPEGVLHMLPADMGETTFSLWANQPKAALCMDIELDENGEVLNFQPFPAMVRIAANLRYGGVEALLDGDSDKQENPHAHMLKDAAKLGELLEKRRISRGAVVMVRPEVDISLSGEGAATVVNLARQPDYPAAHRLVAELMVLASSALADWAEKKALPLIHRTQKTAIPPEYAGVWRNEADLTRVIKAMIPSILEITPGPHAGLGLANYTPMTSPLRRYADLVNEAQLLAYLETGAPRWSQEELERLLNFFSPHLDSAGQTQKFRPRYWKLLYFRQQGDKVWWPGVITDENEMYVFVSLPDYGIFVRGKRELFEERAAPGMEVSVRLGKVNPLYNEIHILETRQRQ